MLLGPRSHKRVGRLRVSILARFAQQPGTPKPPGVPPQPPPDPTASPPYEEPPRLPDTSARSAADVIEEPPPPANAEEFAGAADPARLMLAPGPAHRLVPTRAQEQFVMALSVEDFYTSSNGDRWQLVCDTASGRSFVRHEPNLSSGGRVTDTDVEEFLNRTGSSPENLALRALLDKHKGTGGS